MKTRGKVILVHQGHELSDIASVLSELGLTIEEYTTGLPDEGEFAETSLVIASAQRLLESPPPHLSAWPTTFVAVRDPSKTLSAHLHRIGASMILCLPVHPQALRLLLLHAIYRGPERRVRERTAIGHRVRVGSGLFRSKATLLELSPTGARIQMARMPKHRAKLRLQIGKELTLGRPLRLETTVVRSFDTSDESKQGHVEVGLSFLNASSHTAVIEKILTRFVNGPAPWKAGSSNQAATPGISAERPGDAGSRSTTSPPLDTKMLEDVPATATYETLTRAACDATVGAGIGACDLSDRRTKTRVSYNRHVVALDEEAARVLVGRDLSPGGMRVVSNSSIALNDRFRVAIHCGLQIEPLVVMARAHRDDDDGLMLVFEEMTIDAVAHLEKIIANCGSIRSPLAPNRLSDAADQPLVIGELIEPMPESSRASGDSESPANVHPDP